MVEVKEEEEKKVRCLLVAPPPRKGEDGFPYELKGLIDTLGFEFCKAVVLNRIEPHPTYGIGTGKAQEISAIAKEVFAECIIFDWELQPSKQRNWEKLTGIPCFDRNEVIIRIFAQRAQTKEAALQVELAKLTYSLPRLSHSYGDMARQRGGSYGSKGSGETQLELDRRQVENKILQIKKELEQVEIVRTTQRKQRQKTATPACALVGYTNAGKSSLLNALTGADVFVEDKLFATLDPTTRKITLAEGGEFLLTDTVGFISNLPHTLIDAFKSTLEETSLADLLLIVIDSSDENCGKQYAQVLKVLKEIGAEENEKIILLNKTDKIKNDEGTISKLKNLFPDALYVSAKTQEGFEELLNFITKKLLGEIRSIKIPMERCDLVELVRKNGTIIEETWQDTCIELKARLPESSRTLALIKEFLIN